MIASRPEIDPSHGDNGMAHPSFPAHAAGRVLALCPALLLLVLPGLSPAQQEAPGTVQIPVQRYDALVDGARQPDVLPPEAPGSFALGSATASVTVGDGAGAGSATVEVDLAVQVLEDGWVGIPLLPAGVPLTTATANSSPIHLVPGRGALLWGVEKHGTWLVHLEYTVDARTFEAGRSLSIPLPEAATRLAGVLPGVGLDVAVLPGSGLTVTEEGDQTRLAAAVPPGQGVLLSWRTPRERGVSISRASYTGVLQGDAITWTASFGVDAVGDGAQVLPLLPADVVLVDLRVDGEQAPIRVVDGRFAAEVRRAGSHSIAATFRVPVTRGDGPDGVRMRVPQVPVSRFELDLPGDLQVNAEPGTGLTLAKAGGRTRAAVNVPMTEEVALSWSAAIPEEVAQELRANASIYHAVHAEEGVLYVRAVVEMEVTSGRTNRFDLAVPPGAQVNAIQAEGGAVADWRVARPALDKPGVASVFLDREVEQGFLFEVLYEKLLGSGPEAGKDIAVPLLVARDVHRQRGMVALLASKELTLVPKSEEGLNRVGENQLPAFIRDSVDKTIAHTFKYVEDPPALAVDATVPERKEGRFDARVDTLVSLSDVALQGSATVEVNVKSGSLVRLRLLLPEGVSFGSLSAPSMRDYELSSVDKAGAIDVDFTQDMEGQFRVEITYEKLLGDAGGDLAVPTLAVVGAEVEQGRIAVEALSAVEVKAAQTEQLSSVDVTELPRQLVLRTTNPILLAYKYVQTEPPYRLALRVTRHREVDVQAATIDEASYRTLFTRDGLAVTTARFLVRNRREQFLRLRLPRGSEIWSASVRGESEKPAIAGEKDQGSQEVLIGIINSDDAFPVELVYATPVSPLRLFGRVRAELPHPHMVVTRSQLDVLLPDTLRYGKAKGDMDLVQAGGWVGDAGQVLGAAEQAQAGGPFRITVPESGIRYSFSRLYANQRDDRVTVSIAYSTIVGNATASILAFLATSAFWALLLALTWRGPRLPGRRQTGALAALLVVAVFCMAWLPGGGTMPLLVTLAALSVAAVRGLRLAWRRVRGRIASTGADPAACEPGPASDSAAMPDAADPPDPDRTDDGEKG